MGCTAFKAVFRDDVFAVFAVLESNDPASSPPALFTRCEGDAVRERVAEAGPLIVAIKQRRDRERGERGRAKSKSDKDTSDDVSNP